MRYTTLLLDLDNTLLDFNKAEEAAIIRVLKEFSLPYDNATVKTYSEINSSFWKRFEKGEIPKNAIFEGRFIKLLEVLDESRDSKAISEQYIKNLSEGYFTIDGAIEILEYLKNKGYFLCAATNGFSITQHKRVKNSGLEPYFNKIFISEDAGHQKPEKEYFDFIIDNIPEKDRAKILLIGDSQSSDILGGINAGIDTCWYNPSESEKKYFSNYEIKNLFELKNIL